MIAFKQIIQKDHLLKIGTSQILILIKMKIMMIKKIWIMN